MKKGKDFENRIENILKGYFVSGIAYIWKTEDNPTHREKQPPDFIGITNYYNKKQFDKGIAIAIECKSQKTDIFKMGIHNTTAIKIHQLKDLYIFNTKFNGIGLLFIELREIEKIFIIEVGKIEYEYLKTCIENRKNINEQHLRFIASRIISSYETDILNVGMAERDIIIKDPEMFDRIKI